MNNGVFIFKNKYLKLLFVKPINYELKSNLEKEAILNSYKTFLKTCDFNFKILIQSKKEDLNNHISIIKDNKEKEENELLRNIYNDYIEYISVLNNNNKSSSKNFYIMLEYEKDKKENSAYIENIIISNLNEKYYKIKECLSRCGNSVYSVDEKREIINIFYSFYNCRKHLNNSMEGEMLE